MDAPSTENLITEPMAELIALAAAMAASNEEAFEQHNARLEALGVSRGDRIQAVNIALQVKMGLHRNLMEMAQGSLVGEGGCCSGSCGECESECSGEEGCGCEAGQA